MSRMLIAGLWLVVQRAWSISAVFLACGWSFIVRMVGPLPKIYTVLRGAVYEMRVNGFLTLDFSTSVSKSKQRITTTSDPIIARCA